MAGACRPGTQAASGMPVSGAAAVSQPPAASGEPLVSASGASSGGELATGGGLLDSSGQPVQAGFGGCWGTGFSGPDPACGAAASAVAGTAAAGATARPAPGADREPLTGASNAGAGSANPTSGGLVDSSGQPVRTGFGDCWGTGFSGPDASCAATAGTAALAGAAVAPGAATRPAAATSERSALAAAPGGSTASAALAPANARGNPGYLVDSDGVVVRSGYGECWRTGSWSPALATVVGCDGVLAKAEPVPAPAPSPRPAPPPPPEEPATTDERSGADLQAAPESASPPAPPVPTPAAPSASEVAPSAAAPSTQAPPAPSRPAPAVPTPPSAAPSDLAPPRAAPEKADAAPRREPAQEEPRTEKVTLATDTYFDFDKSVLKPEGRRKLDELASRLLATTLEVVVATGHTDWTGSDSYNQRLSERRALAVKQYLASKGVPADRIFTEGKGEKQPVASNKTREGRAQNRRVEVEVVGTRPAKSR